MWRGGSGACAGSGSGAGVAPTGASSNVQSAEAERHFTCASDLMNWSSGKSFGPVRVRFSPPRMTS